MDVAALLNLLAAIITIVGCCIAIVRALRQRRPGTVPALGSAPPYAMSYAPQPVPYPTPDPYIAYLEGRVRRSLRIAAKVGLWLAPPILVLLLLAAALPENPPAWLFVLVVGARLAILAVAGSLPARLTGSWAAAVVATGIVALADACAHTIEELIVGVAVAGVHNLKPGDLFATIATFALFDILVGVIGAYFGRRAYLAY